MDYDDPYQDLSIHIKKGYQLLDGDAAMGVVRFRDGANGYADGDLGRIGTQQGFMKAVMKQLLQIKNVTKINEFAKIFSENVSTDLSLQNLLWFGKSAVQGGLTIDHVNFVTMPNISTSCWSRTYQNYQSYVVPDPDKLLDLVNNELSPFKEKVTLSDLDIMSVNKDGSISSTTGTVEDKKASSTPSVPANADTTPVDNDKTVSGSSDKTDTTDDSQKSSGTSSKSKSHSGSSTGSSTGGSTGGSTASGGSGGNEGTSGNTGSTGETGTTGGSTGNSGDTTDTGEGTGAGNGDVTEPTVPEEPTGGSVPTA
jgi:uncharacterized membrane protein YgcG